MKSIGDKCDLLEEDGKIVDMEMDERGDFHFNALLDAVADWRKQTDTDCSLEGIKHWLDFLCDGLTPMYWLNPFVRGW